MRFCRICGTQLEENTHFCPKCGTQVVTFNPAPPSATSTKLIRNDPLLMVGIIFVVIIVFCINHQRHNFSSILPREFWRKQWKPTKPKFPEFSSQRRTNKRNCSLFNPKDKHRRQHKPMIPIINSLSVRF